MINKEVFIHNPETLKLLNDGVSKVAEISREENDNQIKVLKFELSTFVCDGEYSKGLSRILDAYLQGLNSPQQKAVWVSGFFGSGKSHLVKMLRYLWEDYQFPDGTKARSLVKNLPVEINDKFIELSTRAKQNGGLRAAAGTLGSGSMDNVRLAFIQLLLRAADLPENLAIAKFLLWLRKEGLEPQVDQYLRSKNRSLRTEVNSLYQSTVLAESLVAARPKFDTVANTMAAIRSQFREEKSPTIQDAISITKQIFGDGEQIPLTLLVVDEIQQFIGENIQRAIDVQEIVEACCTLLQSRLLFVGTGQSALNQKTPSLQRLQARFSVPVQLSDTDVESVIRQTILLKKPEKKTELAAALADCHGEIARQLQDTRLAATQDDDKFLIEDYPLLPTRRRFWEKVLRNTDKSATRSQLRSQLQIVLEATRETAGLGVGHVVTADFIYDQIYSDLLNTGQLEREYDEIIRRPRDGTDEGKLCSRIAALIYLIGKLPRSAGIDDRVRATRDTIIDLLISDLRSDRPKLEQSVPGILQKMVNSGQIMPVDQEYRLQTRESASWTSEFNRRFNDIIADLPRIGIERTEHLKRAIDAELRHLPLNHGRSRPPRKLDPRLSSNRPESDGNSVVVWLRDGWSDDKKSILQDARAATTDSPMVFAFLPRLHHEELQRSIATVIAGTETIDSRGTANTSEAAEAKSSVETRINSARAKIDSIVGTIIREAEIYLGGGQEVEGDTFKNRITHAANSSLVRLFPKFEMADNANWSQVVTKAKALDPGSLAAVDYSGAANNHPVCRALLEFIGNGKKGREVHERYLKSPFGWPKDAIDGALYTLLVAGNLKARENHQPVQTATLAQNKIGTITFEADVPPLNAHQRLELKALFQKLSISTPDQKESETANKFLISLVNLGNAAGGEAPRPLIPDLQPVKDLQMLSGNAQLLKIHEQAQSLAGLIDEWSKQKQGIESRWPSWVRLTSLHAHAQSLPSGQALGQAIDAIVQSRSLLANPDPLPTLINQIAETLRSSVLELNNKLVKACSSGNKKLESSEEWNKLTPAQKNELIETYHLANPTTDNPGSVDELLAALAQSNLASRKNQVDATLSRFNNALTEAAKLITPQAVRFSLPSRTIHNPTELEAWLAEVRTAILEKLDDKKSVIL